MDINWFTVIAQVFNFLILVWLLKKFLYKPVLNAVNEREKKITDQLKDADAQRKLAQEKQVDFQQKNEDFDSKKAALLDKAIAEANAEKQQLVALAKKDAKAAGIAMKKAFEEQQEQEKKERAQNTQEQLFAIARRALKEIASVSLENQAIAQFIKHLKALKDQERQQFIAAFKSNSKTIFVKSAFTLTAAQKQEITEAVNKLLSAETVFEFKTTPEVISGIELSTNGYKMGWSLSEYLNTLQKSISAEIKEQGIINSEKRAHVST
ncbi:hypothetical protein K8354_18145 [Polaribacter litorisediminis]|uniref:F0F1 ATP synthase subunit delta n=1 Tax=Polaribacter litorisediminis TaxID=1908341 RepID=UPI001CBB274C|nr:hypothetical protein [Polaribacter litorisediminis]UAM98170.1 hypothetical protein K8354_18145 [Polaribacter litorisediminis]